MGTPYEGNRTLNPNHLGEFIRQFRRADPQFMTHPIIVSVRDEETLERAADVNNYDWEHICEVSFVIFSCDLLYYC